jgi:hypothetical protein
MASRDSGPGRACPHIDIDGRHSFVRFPDRGSRTAAERARIRAGIAGAVRLRNGCARRHTDSLQTCPPGLLARVRGAGDLDRLRRNRKLPSAWTIIRRNTHLSARNSLLLLAGGNRIVGKAATHSALRNGAFLRASVADRGAAAHGHSGYRRGHRRLDLRDAHVTKPFNCFYPSMCGSGRRLLHTQENVSGQDHCAPCDRTGSTMLNESKAAL